MEGTSNLNRKLHALLIGVDCYLPNSLPDGGFYPSLNGCVRDINNVESVLTKRLGVPREQIIKLMATNDGGTHPPEPEAAWPTYENMVAAFHEIIGRAQPGEQLYVHFSGHGGRTPTAFPNLKGAGEFDESLVPTDIGRDEARYLRDVEVAYLLSRTAEKELLVTLVLDSCHSGGATRGRGGGSVRGIPSIDTTPRPAASLVATPEELGRAWLSLPPKRVRNAGLGAGWMPEPPNTVLLAACRANELANEYPFEGGQDEGALTYWLLEALRQVGPGLTYKMVHDRVLAKVRARFPRQTPQLHGDGSRVVFDTARVPQLPSVRVLQVDRDGRRVTLDAGETHGLHRGARFAIFPAQATAFTDAARIALAEAEEIEATTCRASLTDVADAPGLEEGAQAVLLDAGSIRFSGRVRLVRQAHVPPEVDQESALERLAREVEQSAWVRLAGEGEEADFQVAVNVGGEYEFWEPDGQVIRNLRPALKAADADAPRQAAQRLVHLTKYRNVKLIDNASSSSPLARLLTVEVVGPDGGDVPGGLLVLDVGESATLRITNNSDEVLNITAFNLQPDWGIKQVFPANKDAEPLDPGHKLERPLKNVRLPEGYTEAVDTLKVFATVEQTSFRVLELPALGIPPTRRRSVRAPQNALERLLADFTADAPPSNRRTFDIDDAPVTTWTTAQIDFKVRRPPRALKHVEDPATSLLQAAFEEVWAEKGAPRSKSRSGGAPALVERPSLSDAEVGAITDFLADQAEPEPSETAKRGVWDTAKYCTQMAVGAGRELYNAYVRGDREQYDAYKAALTEEFGGCDPKFKDALIRYAEFVARGGKIPYRRWQRQSDSVFEGLLPPNATLGVVGDWGTGQHEALEVLRQVARQGPHVVIHLGDVYYAGTAREVEEYFVRPWREILRPEQTGVATFAVPGNHDYYSGGEAFFAAMKGFGQEASYFCLRNEHWQFIGLDTALNDKLLGGPPTTLDPSEVEWLRDKVKTAGGRRTVLLSHHQLFSANERFDGSSFNERLHAQVADLLPEIDVWLWGHEHDLVVFGEYVGLRCGRCVGGSAFRVGKFEMPDVPKNPEVPFDREVALSKGPAFYQHCYAVVRLDGPRAIVSYYENSDGGRELHRDKFD